MRLLGHINESSDYMPVSSLDKFNEDINKKCKPYLKLITKNPLYRGMSGVPRNVLGIKQVRKDRRTKLMDRNVAKYLNDWLGKNKHARRDMSVICSPTTDALVIFGAPYYIFPVGNIKYTYVESPDMNWVDSNSGWYPAALARLAVSSMDDDVSDDDKFGLRKPFKDYFHSDKFSNGYNKGFEFWIECDAYYFASEGVYDWDNKKKVLV